METERASPSTMVSQGQGSAGASLPSTSANSARERERPHRARHGEMRRLADIDEVDFVHARFADADRHGASPGCARTASSRVFRRQLLGVVQALGDALAVEDHCRRHHRTGERTAAGFIHAGDGAGHASSARATSKM